MECKTLIVGFFLLFIPLCLFGQTTASSSAEPFSGSIDIELNYVAIDWAFFEDKEQNNILIDLGELGGPFSHLEVKNENGDVVFKDELFEIPSNTIYELDLNPLAKGAYKLKIHTYTQPIIKALSVE